MTRVEALHKIEGYRAEREQDARAIVEFAGSLIPTLLDAQRGHAAKELERLLFIYDAHSQECAEWTKQNLAEVLRLATEEIK